MLEIVVKFCISKAEIWSGPLRTWPALLMLRFGYKKLWTIRTITLLSICFRPPKNRYPEHKMVFFIWNRDTVQLPCCSRNYFLCTDLPPNFSPWWQTKCCISIKYFGIYLIFDIARQDAAYIQHPLDDLLFCAVLTDEIISKTHQDLAKVAFIIRCWNR